MIDCAKPMHFPSCSILGRVKDIFKHLIAAKYLKSKDELKGEVPRGWVVLSDSDEGQKRGADAVIKELEVWYQPRLGNYKWLHGGIEIVEKVYIHPWHWFKSFPTKLILSFVGFRSRHGASR